MSFVFYDTETTGLNTAFDQILQFGAILTDDDLNELDRVEMRCRLEPHTVPSAGAFRTTGMTIERATDVSLPTHYEMVCTLRERVLAWCPATFVGWNTMGYDEHLLRQAFYKCLHPPYLTNTKGNQRSDIMKLAQCVEAFAPEVLVVPLNAKGRRSYRLQDLAPANGFGNMNAHDAVGDVEATIFVCRLIKDKAPSAWENLLHCASKSRVLAVVDSCPVFVLRDYYPSGGLKEFALTRLGDEPNGMGAVLAFDLNVDPTRLLVMNDQQLELRLKKSPKLVRKIRPNAAPFVVALTAGQSFGGLAYRTLIERAEFLTSRPDVVERLLSFCKRSDGEPSDHVEEQLYGGGFPSPADTARMMRFHSAEWCNRYAIVEQFEDPRYRTLGRRLVHTHCPESLPEAIRLEQDKFVASRILGHGHESAPWATLTAMESEAIEMEEDGNPDHIEMLKGLRAFLADKAKQASQILGL